METGHRPRQDPQGGARRLLRFLRRHVRHLPPGGGARTGARVLRVAEDVRLRQVAGRGLHLRRDARRPSGRSAHLRPFRRPRRAPQDGDRLDGGLRHGDAVDRADARLRDARRHLGGAVRRAALHRRLLRGRRLHLRQPAGDGVLAQGQAVAQQRDRHERLPGRLRRDRAAHAARAPDRARAAARPRPTPSGAGGSRSSSAAGWRSPSSHGSSATCRSQNSSRRPAAPRRR